MSRWSRSAAVLVGVYHFLMQACGWKLNGKGFALGVDSGRSVHVEVTNNSNDIAEVVEEMRKRLIQEARPPAPSHRGKCVQCYYIRYCADML